MACDCTILPIQPYQCVEECAFQAVSRLTPYEKILILGLEPSVAFEIFRLFQQYPLRSFSDLRGYLAPIAVDHLLFRYTNINQFQLNYINASRRERSDIIQAMERLRIDFPSNRTDFD